VEILPYFMKVENAYGKRDMGWRKYMQSQAD
jgi:hypothetical protein